MVLFNVQNKYSFGSNTVPFKGKTAAASEADGTIWDAKVKTQENKPVTKPGVKMPDSPQVKSAKSACAGDLAAFKNAGVKVSDWDDNNSCTLSYFGKTATVTIDKSGKVKFDGDFEFIMNHLLKSDEKQKQSMENYDKFLAVIKGKGDEVINQKVSSIKVEGKETNVVELTIKSKDGQQYQAFLDDDGNQITPDK